jgi:hypothetical protein
MAPVKKDLKTALTKVNDNSAGEEGSKGERQ